MQLLLDGREIIYHKLYWKPWDIRQGGCNPPLWPLERRKILKYAIQRNGKSDLVNSDTVLLNDGETLRKEYVVRLIYDNVFKKTVVAEEVFYKEPTEEQIIWCLKIHQEATFAVVANRYVIKGSDTELPFK